MTDYDFEQPIELVLADDHEVVRAGLRRLLSIDKSIKILDEADNGRDIIEHVKYYKPHIALLDILMPIMNGIEAAKIIKEDYPGTYAVILTAYEDYNHLEQAIAAGADGYLTKDIGARELIGALHTVVRGERVFSRSILKLLQKKYMPTESPHDSSPVTITRREQEILNLVAQGKKSSDIADKLFISIRTVESHRYNIMQKLGVKNATGLVRYALTNVNVKDPGK